MDSDSELLIDAIKDAWGWAGVDPCTIIAQNAFGNVIFTDHNGRYWRLCPEDLYCEIVAEDQEQFSQLTEDEEFVFDWEMVELVLQAQRRVGSLAEGYCYCLTIPGALGGEYGGANLNQVPIRELIQFSGSIAFQSRDLPDGAWVKLEVID